MLNSSLNPRDIIDFASRKGARRLTAIAWMQQFKDVGWLVGFYGISTIVGYLTPNPFLCK